MTIGFIGLGIMGIEMASNIQEKYSDMVVWNRSAGKAKELVKKGARQAKTPAEAAAESDVLITMLTTPEVVEGVALGNKGFLDSMKKGALWIDSTSVNPSFSERMAEEAKARGVRFIDAPVAGSQAPARDGKLVILAGGEEDDVKEAQPIFELVGRKTVYAGPAGFGARMKMAVNLMLGQGMAAFAETVYFGRAIGLPEELVVDTLMDTPLVPPMVKMKLEKFQSGEFEAEFPLEWMHKDLHLASVTAYENDAILPISDIVKELFGVCKRSGQGREDFSAIYTVFDKM